MKFKRHGAKGGVVNKLATKVTIDNDAGGVIVNDENIIGPPFPLTCTGVLPVVAGLRPKQVRAYYKPFRDRSASRNRAR